MKACTRRHRRIEAMLTVGRLPAIWPFRSLATQYFSKAEMRQDGRLMTLRDVAHLARKTAGNLAICSAVREKLPATRRFKLLAIRFYGKAAKRQFVVAPFAWI